MDILGADRFPSDVHDIADSNVRHNIQHPKHMIQSRDIPIISIVVEDSSCRGDPFVLQQMVVPRDVATAHVRETIGQVCLLPLPPEPIDVGVMQIEQRVSGAGALELKLSVLSAMWVYM